MVTGVYSCKSCECAVVSEKFDFFFFFGRGVSIYILPCTCGKKRVVFKNHTKIEAFATVLKGNLMGGVIL